MDLSWSQPWLVCVGYAIIGRIALMFIYNNGIDSSAGFEDYSKNHAGTRAAQHTCPRGCAYCLSH